MGATFDDGKDEGALRTIGELSAALGIRPHVLRYWEEQFPMLRPLKRSGNRRYYRREDVALVEAIDRLVNGQGYTLKGARQVIEDGRTRIAEDAPDPASLQPASAVGRDQTPASPQAANDAVAELKDIRDQLAKALRG